MWKLTKYEFRRNITGVLVMLAALAGIEAYFLGAALMKNDEHVLIASALLMITAMIAIGVVFIYSISLYSKELAAKTSYLTFMTPNSATKILGAKLLSTLLLGLGYAAILYLFAMLDVGVLRKQMPQINFYQLMLERFMEEVDFSLANAVLVVASFALSFLADFFTTVVVAYLAITLSATALQNRKGKGLVSMLLFVGIVVLLNWLQSLVPVRYEYETLREMLISSIPQTLIGLAFAAPSFVCSAWLLKYKVSL